jgi:Xaa-Pro aminopeptidase
MVPYDKNLINKKILNKNEVKYINNYHSKVYENLKNLMNKKELSFLKKICSPI